MIPISSDRLVVIDGADAVRYADKPVILHIDDPHHTLGSTPAILLHRAGRTPAILARSAFIGKKGKGRFFGWMPAGLVAISMQAGADAATGTARPSIRMRSPGYAEIALRIGMSFPFAAMQTLRLLLHRNIKGFQYRFVRLFEALSAPRYDDWVKRPVIGGMPEGEACAEAPFAVFVTIVGDERQAHGTRKSIARQTCPFVREVSHASLHELLAKAGVPSFWMCLPAGFTLEETAIDQLVRPLLADDRLAGAYCDEDCLRSDGTRFAPFFKPAWNAPLAETGWLPQEGALVRLSALPDGFSPSEADMGSLLEKVSPYGDIVHIPRVLLHRDTRRPPAPASLPREPARPTNVSVVIPTRDRADLLRTCLDGLFNRTRADELDVIVIDNDSREQETLDLLHDYEHSGRIRRLPMHGSFNFSLACNLGAEAARHELLLLLNNDIDPIEQGWLEQMAAELADPRIGAAGALLLFPDGSVQHAGVTLGAGSVGRHNFHFRYPDAGEDFGLISQRQDVSAVTAACLLTRKSLWRQVGGMNADRLPVAFNDVDYCLKLREKGYGILWTPHARLIHRESVSRGSDDTAEKIARFAAEEQYMHERWGATLMSDPFYNPNLSLAAGDRVLEAAPRDLSPRLARIIA
ncbi:glycosyltransferase family 2 protein [Shinella sp. BYT-45]|uniref:glycosyltransferase family 2 protein n=1 Tax=Shinella sp. BYT-45 TaxID=3377377 RepID=UPI00397F2705